MRIVNVRERTIPISRYEDHALARLTTSIVAVTTDTLRHGRPVIGYGFASVGRYGQGGLIRERFAPRLVMASENEIAPRGDRLIPAACWAAMMRGEKQGGHGERCVAVGALDMAIWDAASKIAGMPLHAFIASELGNEPQSHARVAAYASGGYTYPDRDIERLSDELRRFSDQGFTRAKIKIGANDLEVDSRRIEAAIKSFGFDDQVAVDAMNVYDESSIDRVTTALNRYPLWWFEDPCDPLDFATQAGFAERSRMPIAAGEALFSLSEAKLLDRHGGLDRGRDKLVFDPVHCYGLTAFIGMVDWLAARGWARTQFWPHGGSLFSQHLTFALSLGGVEITPLAFHPFQGLARGQQLTDGMVSLPDIPGIGFETHPDAWAVLASLGSD